MRKGQHHTEESRRELSMANKGHIPWNKNKTNVYSKRALRKMSEAKKGKPAWNKGKMGIYSEEALHKISEAQKGHKHWLGKHHTVEAKYRMSEVHKGKYPSEETRFKMSKALKRNWQDPDYVYKIMLARQIKPNRAERKLDAILQEVCPGEFALNVRANIMVLGGKVPDFVNVNGKKQLIELYGDYFHDPKHFPDIQSPQERIDYFRQFGDWDTLIIWEHELKDEVKLKQKLRAFIKE